MWILGKKVWGKKTKIVDLRKALIEVTQDSIMIKYYTVYNYCSSWRGPCIQVIMIFIIIGLRDSGTATGKCMVKYMESWGWEYFVVDAMVFIRYFTYMNAIICTP